MQQARSRPVVRRHCWVHGLQDAPGRWPGLLVEWRQTRTGPAGRAGSSTSWRPGPASWSWRPGWRAPPVARLTLARTGLQGALEGGQHAVGGEGLPADLAGQLVHEAAPEQEVEALLVVRLPQRSLQLVREPGAERGGRSPVPAEVAVEQAEHLEQVVEHEVVDVPVEVAPVHVHRRPHHRHDVAAGLAREQPARRPVGRSTGRRRSPRASAGAAGPAGRPGPGRSRRPRCRRGATAAPGARRPTARSCPTASCAAPAPGGRSTPGAARRPAARRRRGSSPAAPPRTG